MKYLHEHCLGGAVTGEELRQKAKELPGRKQKERICLKYL
jgi:hypothetical protein